MTFLQQFTKFVREGSDDDADWRAFLAAWREHLDAFSAGIGTHVDEREMEEFLVSLMIPVLRNGFGTAERQLGLFNRLQALGWHLTPVHFYSPVPDTSSLPDELWPFRYDTVPGWSVNESAQFELLSKLSGFSGELGELLTRDSGPDSFDSKNGAFSVLDASFYYAMIRWLRPARVIEIGGGHSTRMAALAALQNGDTVLDVVEPYPLPFLSEGFPGLNRLIQQPVQSVPPDTFTALEANDFLFIDSSHVCKAGSDVNYLILEILPRLKPGVVVHFHDIFLPWNMPRKWIENIRLFWNEQYLLLAFLQGNRDFEVVLAIQYLNRCHPERLKEAFPCLNTGLPMPGGASFWIRRVNEPG